MTYEEAVGRMPGDQTFFPHSPPDVKGRIIGVQAQMLRFHTLFGPQLCKQILKITDNLNRTLQRQSMSAAKEQALTEMTSRTLQGMCTKESFTVIRPKIRQVKFSGNNFYSIFF